MLDLQVTTWARRLKLRHMEMLLALHAAGSLSQAAQRVHLTQPAMSHWLAEMEDIVGAPLFHRRRPLALTPAGEVLLRYAQRMVRDVQRIGDELAAVQSGRAARLNVGTILSAAPLLLPRALARLQREHPGQTVAVVEAGLTELVERLEKRELDVVIGALDQRTQRPGLASEALLQDSVQVVARRGHPFARKRRPQWDEAARHPWIMAPGWSLLRTRLEDAFVAQGVQVPVPLVETTSSLSIVMLLRETGALCAMRGSVARLHATLELVEPVRLAPAIEFPDVGIVWSPDRTNATLESFLAILRTEAQRLRREQR